MKNWEILYDDQMREIEKRVKRGKEFKELPFFKLLRGLDYKLIDNLSIYNFWGSQKKTLRWKS